jgi:hypothetical protein
MMQSKEHVGFVLGDALLDAVDSKGSTRATACLSSGAADSITVFSYRGPPAVADHRFTVRSSGGASSPRSDG